MKKVKLTQGKYALVDDADFVRLNAFKGYIVIRLWEHEINSKIL